MSDYTIKELRNKLSEIEQIQGLMFSIEIFSDNSGNLISEFEDSGDEATDNGRSFDNSTDMRILIDKMLTKKK